MYEDAPNRLSVHSAVLLSAQAQQQQGVMNEEIVEEFGSALRRHAPRWYHDTLFSAGRWYFLAGRRWKGARFMVRFLLRRPLALGAWAHLVLGLLGPWALVWAHQRMRGVAGG